jgi:hypothetical protein
LKIVIVIDVAAGTRNICVASGEREARGSVIELSVKPTVKTVAALAIRGREGGPCAGVRRISGVLPILEVAGVALRGKAVENSGGELRVALIALKGRVRAEKRKAILVILHLLNIDTPAFNGVTLGAVWAHLAAMNIRVAIRAIFADICEHRFDVALGAVHFFVHAAEGILGFVVVKLRNSANGAPSCSGVAIFARHGKRTMRAFRGLLLRIADGGGGMSRNLRRTVGGGEGE